MRKIVTLLLTLLLLTASSIATYSPAKAEPRTIVVPDDFSTIQEAINNSSAGDTIMVRSGTYNEALGINKPISLIGQNPQDTIITTNQQDSYYYTPLDSAIIITASDVVISGFTVQVNANVIWIYEGNAKISNNIIQCLSSRCVAVGVGGSGNSLISSNTISGCGGTGVTVGNTGNTIVSNNLISGFSVGVDSGAVDCSITNNTISDNSIGLNTYGSPTAFSYNNIIGNSQYSIDPHTVKNVDATYNWWGTTDIDAINQTIANFNSTNPNLGYVTFVPFLTEANPQAMPNPSVSITIPTRTPSPSPPVPEYPSWGILPLFIIVTFIAALFYFKKRKHQAD
jgi:parallel beta-helix repeat protein